MSRWADNYDGPHVNVAYMIIPVAEVTDEIIEAAVQTSRETMRKSLDGTQAVLKFRCSVIPELDTPVFDNYVKLSHTQATALLDSEDWTDPDPFGEP